MILTILLAVVSQMVVAFGFCYLGQLATDRFKTISDRVFEMNWQEFPVGLQKYVIVMIGNMQKPLYYHGSGIIILELNTFLNVSYSLDVN